MPARIHVTRACAVAPESRRAKMISCGSRPSLFTRISLRPAVTVLSNAKA